MYPIRIAIETPDGGGEAYKEKPGSPWVITYPAGGFRWYGSAPSMRRELKKRLRIETGDSTVTFCEVSDER